MPTVPHHVTKTPIRSDRICVSNSLLLTAAPTRRAAGQKAECLSAEARSSALLFSFGVTGLLNLFRRRHLFMAAAPDPRFNVTFSRGNPTAANLTASGGEPLLDLDQQHWLVVACGGDLIQSPNGGTLKSILWRELEVVCYKVFYIAAAINGHNIDGYTVSTATITSLFSQAHAGGLTFGPRPSRECALAEIVRVALPLSQAARPAWTLGPASLQTLPAHQGAAVPAALGWTTEMKYGMLSTMEGAPRGVAIWCAMSPSRMTSAGRRQVEFTDVFDELSELAEVTRPGWNTKADRLKAVGLASILMQKLTPLPIHLVGCCVGNRAYDLATLFRFPAADAFSGYFAMGWKAGYPSLTKLVGVTLDSAQALALAGRLLGETPSPAALDALEAKILVLLPHLDTPELRAAPALARVAAIEPLLRQVRTSGVAAAGSTESDAAATITDPLTWSRSFAIPLTTAFMVALEQVFTTPLVEHRVARILLSHACPLGIHMVANKVKPPHKMLKQMASGAKPASTLQAVQRHLCVDASNTLRMEWFPAIAGITCTKLFNGHWAVDKSSTTCIDLWAEVAAPLLLKKRGNHFLSKLPSLEPEHFFASEFALRMGGSTAHQRILRHNRCRGDSGRLPRLGILHISRPRRHNRRVAQQFRSSSALKPCPPYQGGAALLRGRWCCVAPDAGHPTRTRAEA